MHRDLRRRELIHLLGVSGIGIAMLPLMGCGATTPDTSPVSGSGDTVVMYDIRMEGWSTLGSGFLGENGILRATQIRDNQPITLPYVQDSHGHKFTLTPEHFSQLRHGNEVRGLMTTTVLGHYHEVRINPRRIVPGSQGIEMPVDP